MGLATPGEHSFHGHVSLLSLCRSAYTATDTLVVLPTTVRTPSMDLVLSLPTFNTDTRPTHLLILHHSHRSMWRAPYHLAHLRQACWSRHHSLFYREPPLLCAGLSRQSQDRLHLLSKRWPGHRPCLWPSHLHAQASHQPHTHVTHPSRLCQPHPRLRQPHLRRQPRLRPHRPRHVPRLQYHAS